MGSLVEATVCAAALTCGRLVYCSRCLGDVCTKPTSSWLCMAAPESHYSHPEACRCGAALAPHAGPRGPLLPVVHLTALSWQL